MNSTALLLKAAADKPPRCLGLQLRPYSLGHDIILSALDNSFLKAERDLNDLFIGVFICAHCWDEWKTVRRAWWLPLFLKLWGWHLRKRDFRKDCEIFESYLQSGYYCPDINVPVGQRRSGTAMPWQQRLKIFLMIKLHMTESEALNRPLALSNMDWATAGELDGTLELFSDRDEAFLNYHANRMKTEANGHG